MNLSSPCLIIFIFLSFSPSPSSSSSSNPYEIKVNYCPSNNGNYTNSSTYKHNLDTLLTSITSNTNINYGFYNLSAGRGYDQVNGIALCRGEVNVSDCHVCLSKITQEIRQLCPNKKQAIAWAFRCMLRYSNDSIFRSLQTQYFFHTHNAPGSSDEIDESIQPYTQQLRQLLQALQRNAAAGDSQKKFAEGATKLDQFRNVYAQIECTPDLTSSECMSCLDKLMSYTWSCCSKSPTVLTMTMSCDLRYNFNHPISQSKQPPIFYSFTPRPGKRKVSTKVYIAIVVPMLIASALLLYLVSSFVKKRTKKFDAATAESSEDFTTFESLQYDYSTLELATNNFSDDNKIGEGGFGVVYKGNLENDKQIAVKRLSKGSAQGVQEFKNEILVVAKLQHRNLVRLLGFCLAGKEKLLVYEYVPNKSLDQLLFDPQKQGQLDWKTRYKIIEGVARGMLYLHEDSQLRIIHRDLKPSNVLLDENMNSKISDFGMAKIFNVNQSQDETSRVVGTYGYMSPEYAMHGKFSVKSDVYSFGVLVLEITSGKKNSNFSHSEDVDYLLSYAWKQWRDGNPIGFVDPAIRDSCPSHEVVRCMHLGLLCVQENVDERPTMATAVLVLDSNSMSLPVPHMPSFYLSGIEGVSNFSKNNQSTTPTQGSINDVSVTEVEPR